MIPAPARFGGACELRRIVIFGSAGSGKSTLARSLGDKLGIPVSHLDVLFWRPGWVEPDNEGFRERVSAAVAGDAWITDGNYLSRTFDLRLPRADTVIWMDTPRLTCVRRVIVRTLFHRDRADLAEGCSENILRGDFPEFVRYTWRFDTDTRPRMDEALERLRPDLTPIRLRNPREVSAFLQRVEAS
jgi:adenylate kinase family enzyme